MHFEPAGATGDQEGDKLLSEAVMLGRMDVKDLSSSLSYLG